MEPGRQFQLRPDMVRPAAEYPVKGYKKAADKVSAQQRLMGAGRGYDVHLDMARKGLTVSDN